MEYDNTPESSNIEDRRGQRGGGGMVVGGGGLGIGAIIIIFAISYFTGISPQILMNGAEMVGVGGSQTQAPPQQQSSPAADQNDPMRKFLAHVLGGTEAVWAKELPEQEGLQYTPATLVLYNGATRSACGGAQAAMGPFYCPLDKKVYLDTSFFRDMKTKLGGGGDFAYAYVVAHEIGHHVQDELGLLDKVDAAEAAGEPDPGQRAFGQGRAAGRLPRRRLGQPCQRELEDSPARRHREGSGDRGGDRRRPPPDRRARLRGAGQLHPRIVGATAKMADHRPEERAHRRLQHVRDSDPARRRSLSGRRHCEKRSDEAIQGPAARLDCFAFGSQ